LLKTKSAARIRRAYSSPSDISITFASDAGIEDADSIEITNHPMIDHIWRFATCGMATCCASSAGQGGPLVFDGGIDAAAHRSFEELPRKKAFFSNLIRLLKEAPA